MPIESFVQKAGEPDGRPDYICDRSPLATIRRADKILFLEDGRSAKAATMRSCLRAAALCPLTIAVRGRQSASPRTVRTAVYGGNHHEQSKHSNEQEAGMFSMTGYAQSRGELTLAVRVSVKA